MKTEKAYKNLIKGTFDILNLAVKDNDMPEQMKKALQIDAFLFGSLKANAQLFEASQLLLNEDGTLKPFKELESEFERLNVLYNQTYLEAEYQFAVNSSQMAAKWSELGSSDRYMLQYRTADDTRVRDTHKSLHNVTLPKEDPFWNSFYPPNGWRCRCTAVEVLKDKYEVSDSDKSIKEGNKATTEIGKDGKNRLEIFRFNPGKEKKLMPPKNPYNKVPGAKAVKEISSNIDFRLTRNEAIKKFVKGDIRVDINELKNPITFTSSGIKEAVNQPHEFIKDKNEMLLKIDEVLKNAIYLGSKSDYKQNPMVSKIHIFETTINDKKTYLINRELKTGEIHFYSVSDNKNVKKGIKK